MPSAAHAALFAGDAVSVTPPATSYDWSDSNLPWRVKSGETLTDGWPASAIAMIVDYVDTPGRDFVINLDATINAANRAVIVRLPAGLYQIKNFSHPQTATNYGLGYYHPNLHGFLGAGADQTIIEMAANSYNQTQLDTVRDLTSSPTSAPIGFYMLRFGSGSGSWGDVYQAGLTYRGDVQQTITNYASGIADQPAPYRGPNLFTVSGGISQFIRFQASAHAATSQPPFECGAFESSRSSHVLRRAEIDGRISPDLDSSRPRMSNIWMGNGETAWTFESVWMHHTNRSRYAVNDGNRAYAGVYMHKYCKIEQIANVSDGLGGTSNAACAGYENSSATITWETCIFSQDNPNGSNGFECAHIGLTTVNGQINSNPSAGNLTIIDPQTSNVTGAIDGYFYLRASSLTHWYSDGLANSVSVTSGGTQLQPYVISSSGTTAAALANAGVSNTTHYLVRTS